MPDEAGYVRWAEEAGKEKLSQGKESCQKTKCGREGLNLHALAGASPSSWCVCQFRHDRAKWNL